MSGKKLFRKLWATVSNRRGHTSKYLASKVEGGVLEAQDQKHIDQGWSKGFKRWSKGFKG